MADPLGSDGVTSEATKSSEARRNRLGLERLIGPPATSMDAPVPGEGTAPDGAIPSAEGLKNLAALLERSAQEQSSALGKSRALCVAGDLMCQLGHEDEGEPMLDEAARVSPRLAVAAMLRLRHSGSTAAEELARMCEASLRQASSAGARDFLGRQFRKYLTISGQTAAYENSLEHEARTNPDDEVLSLERLIHRIAAKQRLGGVNVPRGYHDAVHFAHELLQGAEARGGSFVPAKNFEKKAELSVLRAARLIHCGEIEAAFDELSSTNIDENVLGELKAAFRSTQRGGTSQALPLLREIASRSPSRSVLRSLAALALANEDREALRMALDTAGGESDPFDGSERIFLAKLCSEDATSEQTDATSLFADHPALAQALSPWPQVAVVPERSSDEALIMDLGAELARWHDSTNPRNESRLVSVLSELNARGKQGALCRALELGRTLFETPGASAVEAFSSFLRVSQTDQSESSDGDIALALLTERHLGPEAALPVYRRASETDDVFLEVEANAQRLALGPEARPVLEQIRDKTDSPWLRFCRSLELAIREQPDAAYASSTDEEAASSRLKADFLDLRQLVDDVETLVRQLKVESQTTSRLEPDLAACIFCLGVLAGQGNEPDLRERFFRLLIGDPSRFGKLVTYTRLWNSDEPNLQIPAEGYDWTTSHDITERALARHRFELKRGSEFPVDHACRGELVLGLVSAALSGDVSQAAELASHLDSQGDLDDKELTASLLDDLDELAGNWGRLSSRWLEIAKADSRTEMKRFAYERLSFVDERKGDLQSSLMWQRALWEEYPQDVFARMRLEESGLIAGEAGQRGVSGKVPTLPQSFAASLPPSDRTSYELLAGAEALSRFDFRTAQKALLPLLSQQETPYLALRALWVIARDRKDEKLQTQCELLLAEQAHTDLDMSATALSVAMGLSRSGDQTGAHVWAEKALAAKKMAYVAAQLHHATRDETERTTAQSWQQFAESACAPIHQAELWFQAAQSWLLEHNEPEAERAFERVLEAAPLHRDAFERLLEICTDPTKRTSLLTARCQLLEKSSRERLELELLLAESYSKDGQVEKAKEHLEQALQNHPDNAHALRAHAEISAILGAHESAEQSLLALRDRLPASKDRVAVSLSLAKLYRDHLHQSERAMDAFESVVEQEPKHPEARQALVDIYAELGLADRATSMQTQLILDAKSPEQKKALVLRLATLYELVGRDNKRALATLERARKAWSLDADVIEASVLFMDRHGESGSRGFVLDRVAKDVRRKLEEDRLKPGLLQTLATVSRLRGNEAQSKACAASRAAYLGEEIEPLEPAGLHSLTDAVEDLAAPPGLSRPLRRLLRKTGPAMDAAFSVDLSALAARPLSSGELHERVQRISRTLGGGGVELYVSDSLGARCLPVTQVPLRLIVGTTFEQLDGRPRDYLLLRAFKLLQMGVGALSRSRQEDRWPMIVSLLHLFAPQWRPQSVDGRKAAQARALIEQGLARVGYDDDVPMLALETIGALGNTSEGLGEASKCLANRVALVGVGDIAAALCAFAAGEGKPIPERGPSRFRWMESHPDARDLLLFATSDAFTRARVNLGIAHNAPQEERATQGADGAPFGSNINPSNAIAPAPSPHVSRAPAPPRRGTAPPAPPRRGPGPETSEE